MEYPGLWALFYGTILAAIALAIEWLWKWWKSK